MTSNIPTPDRRRLADGKQPGDDRRPRKPTRAGEHNRAGAPVVVVGDLLLDVIVSSRSALRRATDVEGEVRFCQGGSAATTARWLARLGLYARLITSVGRDPLGDDLVAYLERCHVEVHAVRSSRLSTGRMGVVLDRHGERSFVADRRSATALAASAVRPAWLAGAGAIHCPAYSLFDEPLRSATRRAIELARKSDAWLSVDLSSTSFILAHHARHLRREIAGLQPRLIVGTVAEARAVLGDERVDQLTALAPIVVVKRGARGATVFLRGEPVQHADVPTTPLDVPDTTGAGDAFLAGFVRAWLEQGSNDLPTLPVLELAVRAGHRAAAQQLLEPRPELPLTVWSASQHATASPVRGTS